MGPVMLFIFISSVTSADAFSSVVWSVFTNISAEQHLIHIYAYQILQVRSLGECVVSCTLEDICTSVVLRDGRARGSKICVLHNFKSKGSLLQYPRNVFLKLASPSSVHYTKFHSDKFQERTNATSTTVPTNHHPLQKRVSYRFVAVNKEKREHHKVKLFSSDIPGSSETLKARVQDNVEGLEYDSETETVLFFNRNHIRCSGPDGKIRSVLDGFGIEGVGGSLFRLMRIDTRRRQVIFMMEEFNKGKSFKTYKFYVDSLNCEAHELRSLRVQKSRKSLDFTVLNTNSNQAVSVSGRAVYQFSYRTSVPYKKIAELEKKPAAFTAAFAGNRIKHLFALIDDSVRILPPIPVAPVSVKPTVQSLYISGGVLYLLHKTPDLELLYLGDDSESEAGRLSKRFSNILENRRPFVIGVF